MRLPSATWLGIEGLSPDTVSAILDLSGNLCRAQPQRPEEIGRLARRTLILLFFETSTRTRTSFELAGKRLGADVINISVASSAIKKGETLIDTAMTLNAMHPDVIVVRHPDAGGSACSPITSTARSLMPATAAMSTQPRHCSTPSPSAITRPPGWSPGSDLRRCPAQPGGALEHTSAQHDGLASTAGGAADPGAAGGRAPRRRSFPRYARGLEECDIIMMLRLQAERMQGTLCRHRANISAISASTKKSSPWPRMR